MCTSSNNDHFSYKLYSYTISTVLFFLLDNFKNDYKFYWGRADVCGLFSGEIDDENDIPQDRDWYDYWRLLFAKISVKDIEEFENKYKGMSYYPVMLYT